MTRADIHRLVDEIPDDQVESTARLIKLVKAGRIDPDQAWFWTREWQAGEREVDHEIKAGRLASFDSDEAFIAHLGTIPPPDAS